MKKIIVLFIIFFAATLSGIAQDNYDVVYLKNGGIVKGFIIERRPNDYLKIETISGRVRTIDMGEVEKIEKERERPVAGTQNERRQNTGQYQRSTPYPQNSNRNTQNNNRYSQYNQYPLRTRNYGYDDAYYTPRNSIHFGIKSGLNLTSLSYYDEFEYKAGIHGGVFVEFKFDRFAIQPELLFSMQGAKSTVTMYELKGTSKFNLNYLNIPVMAKFYVIDGLSLEVGPQLGILLSAKGKVSLNVPSSLDTPKGSFGSVVDMKEYTKDVDFSVNFGASYQIPSLPFGFYMRYSLGLTKTYMKAMERALDEDEEISIDDLDIKNRVFQIGAFVKF